MTYSIISKTANGDNNNFVLSDGTTTFYTTHPSDMTDEQVIQEYLDHLEVVNQIHEEDRRVQAEIEANLSG